jgi:membrane protease YdiL (CAAX protease family)
VRAGRDLFAGFLIATLMVFLIYLIERLAGWITITGISLNQAPAVEVLLAMLIMLIVFLVTGWQEELYFRGYLLTNLNEGLPASAGILLSSLLFGLVHLGNPNPTILSVVGIALFGLLMVFSLLRSGSLWLPIGLHAGWNFIEGPLLGFPVSGLSTYRLFQTQIEGNPLLTGGAFGPEAGLVLLPALALGTGLIWIYTRSSPSTDQPSQHTP